MQPLAATSPRPWVHSAPSVDLAVTVTTPIGLIQISRFSLLRKSKGQLRCPFLLLFKSIIPQLVNVYTAIFTSESLNAWREQLTIPESWIRFQRRCPTSAWAEIVLGTRDGHRMSAQHGSENRL
jgi:hypothetical protein